MEEFEKALYELKTAVEKESYRGEVLEVVLNKAAYESIEMWMYSKQMKYKFMQPHINSKELPKHILAFGMRITKRDE